MIELKKVTKRYGEIVAVDRVTLSVNKGEVFVILGPSGCGKTTLLRLLAGFERPDSGEIQLEGRRVNRCGFVVPPNRRNVGMIFQDLALWPHMTVSDHIDFALKSAKLTRRERKDRIKNILARFKLEERGTSYPNQLSGGERQRVALARTIVLEPKILLMDEPLASLDPPLKERLGTMIQRLREEMGITIVYVTHDQAEAGMMADRMAVMNCGGIEQLGSAQELRDAPQNEFVKRFLALCR